jgi:hypothetical protein
LTDLCPETNSPPEEEHDPQFELHPIVVLPFSGQISTRLTADRRGRRAEPRRMNRFAPSEG